MSCRKCGLFSSQEAAMLGQDEPTCDCGDEEGKMSETEKVSCEGKGDIPSEQIYLLLGRCYTQGRMDREAELQENVTLQNLERQIKEAEERGHIAGLKEAADLSENYRYRASKSNCHENVSSECAKALREQHEEFVGIVKSVQEEINHNAYTSEGNGYYACSEILRRLESHS